MNVCVFCLKVTDEYSPSIESLYSFLEKLHTYTSNKGSDLQSLQDRVNCLNDNELHDVTIERFIAWTAFIHNFHTENACFSFDIIHLLQHKIKHTALKLSIHETNIKQFYITSYFTVNDL